MIEIVVVLAVLAILLAILVPIVTQHIEESRTSKATSDVKAIAQAIQRFWVDVKVFPIISDTTGGIQESLGDIIRLEGPGSLPVLEPAGDPLWTADPPAGAECQSLRPGVIPSRDDLVDHLVTNAAPIDGGPGWPLTGARRWKGPYLERLTEDPWGNTYLVNIINSKESCPNASFVLSAGPNGEINTNFDIAITEVNNGIVGTELPGGDDIVFRIE